MRVVALQASPNEDGLTATMAKQALAGAEAGGAETELVHLCTLGLESCRQCENGWGECRREGKCVIDDDMEKVREKLVGADALVLSTPVYFGDVSEVFKNFFDRLRRCQFAGPEERRMSGKFILGIAAAGGGGGGGPTCLVQMERYYAHMGMSVFDQLIVTRRSRGYMVETAKAAGAALVGHVEKAAKG